MTIPANSSLQARLRSFWLFIAFRAALAASRRVAFWPALLTAHLFLRWLHAQIFVGVPWTVEGILAVGALVTFWLAALLAGLWGGLLGWADAEGDEHPERGAVAGVWGLWMATALVYATRAWAALGLTPVAFALGVVFVLVIGPLVAYRFGLPLSRRLGRRWNRWWDDGRGVTERLRVGPDGRWDLRGVAVGAAVGLVTAAIAALGIFDNLEAVTLAMRVRLRNEPWQLASGSIEFSRWMEPEAAAVGSGMVILHLDSVTATETLQRSSEFATNRRILERLEGYQVGRVVLPIPRSPDLQPTTLAADSGVAAALSWLLPLPRALYRYPPLDGPRIERLERDLPDLLAALKRWRGVVLGVLPELPLPQRTDADPRQEGVWNRLFHTLTTSVPDTGSAAIQPYLIKQVPSLRLDAVPGMPPVPAYLTPGRTPPPLVIQGSAAYLGRRRIPLVAPGRMLINILGSDPAAAFQQVSYASVLAGDEIYDRQRNRWVPAADFFRGRTVFLDTLYQPSFETPVGRFRAMELLAMATENILAQSYLRPAGWLGTLLLLLSVGALAGHLGLSHRPAAGALRLLAGFLVLVITSSLIFISHTIWIPVIAAMVAGGAAYVVVMQVAYTADQRDLEDQRRERSALEQSLAISRTIQASLLPDTHLDFGEFQIRTHFEPAQMVGGDFFNVFPLSPERLAIVLGDVAGHGVRGAMYMTVATTLVEARAHAARRPAEVLADVNARLYPKIQRLRMFVSLFYGVLDRPSGRLEWATAGQLPPVLVDGEGTARYLPGQGAPLGAMSMSQYRDYDYTLVPGETVLIASDGLVEARDARGEMVGYARFLETVAAVAREGRHELADNVIRTIKAQSPANADFDDLTVLVVHRAAVAAPVARPDAAPAEALT